MKNRFWIYIFIIVVAVLLFWLRPKRETSSSLPVSATVQVVTNQSSLAKINILSQVLAHTPTIPLTSSQKATDASDKRNPANFEKYIESKNSPIEFYGKVIDQDSNPVPDVKVGIGIRQWYVPVPGVLNEEGRFIHLNQVSDSNGRFEFHGATGDGIDIESIQKDGYQLSPNAPNHFGPASGSFENPMIIKMWKKGVGEQLIGGSHVFGIDSGKTYTLNLMTGKKIEGVAEGDLLVSITRPPDAKPRDKFAWSFFIEAIQN